MFWHILNILDSSVSKQKDPARIVTASAYLLFYRRRSEVPLGGPRFQEIVNNYKNSQEFSDDELAESGEDQGLVANSSQHGSSSPFNGVGAVPRPANGSRSADQRTTVNPQELESLPAYQAHEEEPDSAPMLERDVDMNEGLPIQSVEDGDEGVDLNFNNLNDYTRSLADVNLSTQPWNFDALNRRPDFVSGTASVVGDKDSATALDGIDADGSDIVQDNSSASSGSRRARLDDFDNAIAEDDGASFVEENHVPDIDDPDQIDNLTLHREILNQNRAGALPPPEFKVPVATQDEIEEPATEIHVEEGEGF